MISLKNYDYPVEKFIQQAEKTRWTMPGNPASVRRRLYNMSTEITPSFMKEFNLDNARILTVGSSGDQILTYTLMGASNITVMDANPLSPFYINLKLHAINILTREEFISFFTHSKNNSLFMNESIFKEKILPTLNDPLKTFWNTMYEKGYHDKIFNFDGSLEDLPPYLINDKNYLKTKDKLFKTDISLVLANFNQFHEFADGTYDLIDLSNIFTYVSKNNFFNEVEKLYPYLAKNGLFKLHYGDKTLKDNFDLFGKECDMIIPQEINDNGFFIWQNCPELKKEEIGE